MTGLAWELGRLALRLVVVVTIVLGVVLLGLNVTAYIVVSRWLEAAILSRTKHTAASRTYLVIHGFAGLCAPVILWYYFGGLLGGIQILGLPVAWLFAANAPGLAVLVGSGLGAVMCIIWRRAALAPVHAEIGRIRESINIQRLLADRTVEERIFAEALAEVVQQRGSLVARRQEFELKAEARVGALRTERESLAASLADRKASEGILGSIAARKIDELEREARATEAPARRHIIENKNRDAGVDELRLEVFRWVELSVTPEIAETERLIREYERQLLEADEKMRVGKEHLADIRRRAQEARLEEDRLNGKLRELKFRVEREKVTLR